MAKKRLSISGLLLEIAPCVRLLLGSLSFAFSPSKVKTGYYKDHEAGNKKA